jgi:hypothetical protein
MRLGTRVASVVHDVAPGLDSERLAVLTRYVLWSVRLDDRLDAPGADPAVVRAYAVRVCGLACGDRLAPLAELRRFDADGRRYRRLVTALCDAVLAGADVARWCADVRAGTEPPPTVERYLTLADRDVNYRGFAYALAILAGSPVDNAVLDAALVPACRAVRLANDVRSAARDLVAGRLNVLSLCRVDGRPFTEPAVWREVDRCVRRHDTVMADPTLSHSLHAAVAIYRTGDLRTAA